MARKPSTPGPKTDPKPVVATPKPVRAPAKPKPVVPPSADPAPAPPLALSIDDIQRIRERLDAFTGGTAPTAPPPAADSTAADRLVSLVEDKLTSARAADVERIKALEAEVADAGNRATVDRGEVDVGLRDALDTTDALLKEVARLRTANESLTAELAKLKEAFDRSQREVTDLRAAQQPTRDGGHVLGAETVASLLDQFIGSFKSRLGNLQVSSGDVLLKAGFAELGDGAGFVLPSATAPASDQLTLHEIRLRLDPGR